MKSITSTLCALALVGLSVPARAALVVPGTTGPGANSDGELSITADTVIDLSKATTGTWDQDNTANQGNGVYDPQKWAVVFKYTSVNVLAGKKLTFKNHATRAPVVWLVSGNVTIAGTVDLSGESYTGAGITFHPVNSPLGGRLAEPGPGGFRGGAPWRGGDVRQAAGFGFGGVNSSNNEGRGGAYGSGGAGSYGNPSLIPLIGGSGGGGSLIDPGGVGNNSGWGGGAGGGAILVAAIGDVTINNGSIQALGGNGYTGAGSGGGIRVICSRLLGNGSIDAVGGNALSPGAVGRIRLERVSVSAELTTTPAPSTIDLPNDSTALIWSPVGAPEARILSVNNTQAPADPQAAFGAYTPDVALPIGSNATVIVETIKVEQASRVIVRVTPRNGMTVNGVQVRNATEVNATIKQVISEDPLKIHWEAIVPTLPGHSAIQARIVRP
jgi:hypothetical protein